MPPSLRSYLQQVLSHTSGPNSVPYSEITKAAIEEQLINLQEIFPSLGISVDEFCTNDGRVLHLLKADGTIPVHYQGSKYNIPITIWLTEEFPVEAPIVFVVPTHSMIIKPGHSQVNSSGQAYTPSLCTWNPSNNLVDLTFELSECFGIEPPLYAKPTHAAPSASPPSSASSSASRPRPSPPPPPPPPTYAPPPVISPSSPSTGLSAVPPPPGYPAPSGVPPPPPFRSGSFPAAGGPQLPWAPYGIPPVTSYPMSSNPMYPIPPSPLPPTSLPSVSGPLQPPPPPPPMDSLAAHPIWGAAFSACAQPPPPPPPPPSASIPGSQPYPSTYGQGPPPPPPPPPHLLSSLQPPQPPPPSGAALRGEVNARFKELAIAGLLPQLQAAEARFTEHAALETNELLETQRNLADRRNQLDAIVRGLKQEREGTEGLVKEMGSKSAQLQQWLDRNKPKADALEASGSIDWDAVIVPTDDLSKQALQAQAEDLALEDSIVALDKAFHVGIQGLSLDSYLKQVRALCRRQFFARALGMKAAEMQQHQQPPLRPPPMPPMGVGLTGPPQGVGHYMPPPPMPVASQPPPLMQPMMIPTQALAAASASRPSSQPAPPPPPPPPYMQAATSNPIQPATSNPMQPIANPVIMRPMQSRPIQPYPKVQR